MIIARRLVVEDEHDLVFLTVVAPRQAPWAGKWKYFVRRLSGKPAGGSGSKTQPQDLAPRPIVADERQGIAVNKQGRRMVNRRARMEV